MRLGFLGTGAITEAVVTGLCDGPEPPAIVLSPRNAERAVRLAGRFSTVTVAADNQAVVDAADSVVLALRPPDAPAALSSLRFRAEQTVISFIALLPMTKLRPLVAPATRLCRAIPLPPCARRMGPMALWPALPEAVALLGRIGTVVPIENENQVEPIWTTTSLMAPFYEQLNQVVGWLVGNGVAEDQAASYVAEMHAAWSRMAIEAGGGFDKLRDDSQTPGGLNEQVLNTLGRGGFYDRLGAALDAILERLRAAGR